MACLYSEASATIPGCGLVRWSYVAIFHQHLSVACKLCGITSQTLKGTARSDDGHFCDARSTKRYIERPLEDTGNGDSLDQSSIVAGANGTDSIVHTVNPPGYKNWATLVLPMIENTIMAAGRTGARILLPGTIYNYGPAALAVLNEAYPYSA